MEDTPPPPDESPETMNGEAPELTEAPIFGPPAPVSESPTFGPPAPTFGPPTSGPPEGPRRPGWEVALLFLGLILGLYAWWRVENPVRTRRDSGQTDLMVAERMARFALAAPGAAIPSPAPGSPGSSGRAPKRPSRPSQAGSPFAATWSQAADYYRRALRKDPRLPRARRGLAAVLWMQGDRDGARAVMEGPAAVPKGKEDVWLGTQAAFGAAPRPMDPVTMARYRKALEDKDLGWSRYVALEALSRNAAEAARWRKALVGEYAKGIQLRVGLVVLMGMVLLPAGIAALIWFFTKMPPDRMPRTGIRINALLILFLLTLLVYQLPGLLYVSALGPRAKSLSYAFSLRANVLFGVAGGALAYAVVAGAFATAGHRFSELGWRVRGALKWALGGYLALLPLLGASVIVIAVLQALFPNVNTPPNPAAGMAAASNGWHLALVFVLACVLAPLVEELLFRGLLFPALASRYGILVGALASSLVFAGMHPQLPFGFLPIFVIGAGLCYLYRTTGSLVPGMLVHALNNALAMIGSKLFLGSLSFGALHGYIAMWRH